MWTRVLASQLRSNRFRCVHHAHCTRTDYAHTCTKYEIKTTNKKFNRLTMIIFRYNWQQMMIICHILGNFFGIIRYQLISRDSIFQCIAASWHYLIARLATAVKHNKKSTLDWKRDAKGTKRTQTCKSESRYTSKTSGNFSHFFWNSRKNSDEKQNKPKP